MAKLNGVNVVAESIVYGGATYVKTAEQAEAGDIVRCDDDEYADAVNGQFFEVIDGTDEDGDSPIIVDNAGDSIGPFGMFPEDWTVFRRVGVDVTPADGDIVVHEGVKYQKVQRKANVGELVLIVDSACSDYYFNGDIKRIIDVSSDYPEINDTVGNGTTILWDSEYAVLEPVDAKPTAKPNEQPRLKVGDYAKVVRHGGSHNYEIGDIVEVTGLSVGTLFHGQVVSTGRYGNCLSTKQTVRATDEEVAEAKRKSIKVGDYVRITQRQANWPEGTIVKVTDASVTGYGSTSVICATDDKDTYLSSQFEPVTPAEADAIRKEAEAAHKQAEESAKWDAIGRKVGEIREGDVVRVTRGYSGHSVGTVGIVHSEYDTSSYRVTANGITKISDVELVAPVESLFNAN